jgi:predicted Zn-dependent protease
MFKNVLLSFILVIFSNQAFALDLEAPTQTPVKLSITTDQEAEVKRIYDFFIQDLGKKTEDYQFAIEESDVLNAYATLGKKIIVTTGLIKKLQSEAGLAFVIAHELGHVEQKHVLKGLFRNTIGALIQMFFFKEQNTANTVYQGANFLHSKYYSRSKEKKADLFAVELVNKHYCKAAGKLEFFEEISKETQTNKASEYFSTHPLPQSRIEYLKLEIEKANCAT